MNPIPHINLKEAYRAELSSSRKNNDGNYEDRLVELIKKIEKEDNPVNFKNQLLAITQLFFDGTIHMGLITFFRQTFGNREEEWIEKRQILDKLYSSGKKAVGSFYRGEGVDFDDVKETFMPHAPRIIEYGLRGKAKTRHMVNRYFRVQHFGLRLQDILGKIGMPDTLVCVASGGFEPAFLVMDIAEKESLVSVRYSNNSRGDLSIGVPEMIPKGYIRQNIRGKNVLVIDDVISSGLTFKKVMRYVARMNPHKIYGAIARVWKRKSYPYELISKKPLICRYK